MPRTDARSGPDSGAASASPRASAFVVLSRGVRCRCPACGAGRLFLRGVDSVSVCAVCSWRIERCPGHWVGGNEINVLVSFTTGVAFWIVSALAFGLGMPSVLIATAATGVSGVGLYRNCRGVFYAIDYLLDPAADSASPSSSPPDGPFLRDPRDDAPPAPPPCPPALRRAASDEAPSTASAPESFIPAPPAPYPPSPTVSP